MLRYSLPLLAILAASLSLVHSVPIPSSPSSSFLLRSTPADFFTTLNRKLSSSSLPSLPSSPSSSSSSSSSSASLPTDLSDVECTLCKGLTSVIGPLVRSNVTEDVIDVIAVGVCEYLRIDCSNPFTCFDVCKGIIKEHAHEVIQIVTDTVLAPAEVCYFIKMCPAPTPPPPPKPSVPVPSNVSDHTGEHQWPSWSLKDGEGYFLHLSDIHLDMLYSAGSNNDCGEPLCCRKENGPGTNSSNTAGPWGDHQCDTAQPLLEDLFAHIASLNPPPDFILYTGDDPAHDVWEQSQIANTAAVAQISSLMVQHFLNIPVFSAIGNHEAYPVNQFEGPGFDNWLLDALVLNWAHWLPEDAVHTLQYGGYFQAQVRPGLRVLSINTNYYASGDFWLKEKPYDFSYQLDWLNDTLDQIAAAGEKAIIIGHGPTDGWEDQFVAPFQTIVETYHSSILNLFFGHTHTTSVFLIHDNATNSIPLSVGYVGGSVTPYQGLNQGFIAYTYDRAAIGTNKAVLVDNYQQFWVDVDEVNKDNKTDWTTVQLDAKSAFGMTDLSLQSWQALGEHIRDNADNIYKEYTRGHYKGAVPSSPEGNQDFGCEILTNTDALHDQCMKKAGVAKGFVKSKEYCDVDKEKVKEMMEKRERVKRLERQVEEERLFHL